MKYLKSIACAFSLLAAMSCGNCGEQTASCAGECNVDECASCETKKECCDKSGENDVIENIMSRRSIRKYRNEPVAREVMNEIAMCGINAPNGQNKQSWEVRIVDNPELQDEIKAVMAAAGGERAAGCFYNAPVWVFIARDNGYDFSTIDCGLLAENMMLSAHSLGVGSVCLGSPVRFILTSPEKDKVLSELGFSEGYELCLCIAFGYADEVPQATPRNIDKVKFVE
jgi:nitroreductase